jgi:hypothetical protein
MYGTKYTYSEDPVIHQAVLEAYTNNDLRYSHALSDPRFSWNEDKSCIVDYKMIWTPTIQSPDYSEWKCYLFGGDEFNSISWRPLKGQHPNWFWRKMQYICFGNKWVKDE